MKVLDELTTGAKTLKFTCFYETGDITFKYFLCFMPVALSELPGMFNFEELHKGCFPHAFHTRENLSYRGPIPAKEYFQPQAMKPKKRKEFDTWYAVKVVMVCRYVGMWYVVKGTEQVLGVTNGLCEHSRACEHCDFFASTSRDKKFALRAASSLESTTREQRALLIFSACSNPYGNPFL